MAIKFKRGIRDLPGKLVNRIRNGGLSRHDAYIRDQRRAGIYAFIHINKCGGTSVERALGLPPIHDTARARRDKVGRDRWERMVKFSLVRHPYAKVCSHYRYRRDTGQTGIAEDGIALNDWVRRAYGDRDPAYYNRPDRFMPCADWLVDEDGRLMMDFVCKLETIDADWRVVREMIGVDVDLPRVNVTRAGGAPEDDLDAASRAIIAERFARDFEMFGYAP